jgi:hypothetical protein
LTVAYVLTLNFNKDLWMSRNSLHQNFHFLVTKEIWGFWPYTISKGDLDAGQWWAVV